MSDASPSPHAASSPDPAARALLRRLLDAGLARVHAGHAVEHAITRAAGGRLLLAGRPIPHDARLLVLAAGKAACAMAEALSRPLGERIAEGLVVTKDGHARNVPSFEVRESAHPVPDARCAEAGRAALALARRARPEDVLVVLLSGGASALLTTPPEGLSIDDLAATNRALLACGADIEETNAVRKHLSAISGGRLAQATRAHRVLVLAVSDVPGDRIDVIGSGPCAPDPSTFAQALARVERRGIAGALPAAVRARLVEGAQGSWPESPKPGEPALARVEHLVLARNADAIDAVCTAARAEGLQPHVAREPLAGEAREAATRLVAEARELAGRPGRHLLIAGGETTVTVRGNGRGGRNQELALAAALALDGTRGVTLLAAGSDGSDGPTEAAGALADGGTRARGLTRGVDAAECLQRNDAHGFFSCEGGLVVTGPTGTNVMDLALVVVEPGARV